MKTYEAGRTLCGWLAVLLTATCGFGQNRVTADKEAGMKADLAGQIDGMKKQAQVMVDSVFSFAELGMQEVETSKYLTAILEKEGFKVERGVAGMPTAWLASWGSTKPVISLGSDIDDIRKPRRSREWDITIRSLRVRPDTVRVTIPAYR